MDYDGGIGGAESGITLISC